MEAAGPKLRWLAKCPLIKQKNLFQPVAIHWVSDMLAAFQGVWSCPEEPGWSSALKKFDAGPNSLLGNRAGTGRLKGPGSKDPSGSYQAKTGFLSRVVTVVTHTINGIQVYRCTGGFINSGTWSRPRRRRVKWSSPARRS